MIRIFGILTGLLFTVAVLWSFIVDTGAAISEPAPETAEEKYHLYPKGPEGGFAHEGLFAKWDTAQLQRGYQVYKEVCSACHSLRLVAFRNLGEIGYDEGQVKAEAASWQVPGVDPNTGEATMVEGSPTDYFPKPYANDIAARAANNNAIPPDLSLITKARHDGTNYVYDLLTGYREQPAELVEEFPEAKTAEGQYYNPFFHSLNISMAPPLTGTGQVTYGEGNPEPTIEQMAEDVTAFLAWTAEPTLVKRRQTGWAFLLFLVFATVLAYFSKKQVWARAKGGDVGEASVKED
ncbi:MAG: cytochrome c1 [Sphingomonadales bacterium CG12_big_fil_rev_8_21_14_0_65_65_10]|uniref:Cytochrome c1 n=1 Tax=Blastomonas marina TaxID=1867408 RepID=A0ABQ1FHX1_9SPHN|nr:cytochrome c1 [Blastomonas marina]PIW56252.1 MAG: cytochrome c1 [Sphingomonadales bacterium CG12_big_fil_rev_8_21_14_0_65_65_10]WPZ03375.1 cytochrome c1 [Blastomonas marina]GGA11477.1 ribosomal protein P2 [Blastomonas marina]